MWEIVSGIYVYFTGFNRDRLNNFEFVLKKEIARNVWIRDFINQSTCKYENCGYFSLLIHLLIYSPCITIKIIHCLRCDMVTAYSLLSSSSSIDSIYTALPFRMELQSECIKMDIVGLFIWFWFILSLSWIFASLKWHKHKIIILLTTWANKKLTEASRFTLN